MIIMMGLLFLIFPIEVMGENLEFDEDQEGSVYFYDTGSVKLSLGSVTVWITIYGPEKSGGRIIGSTKNMIPIDNDKLRDLAFAKQFVKINCNEEKYRFVTYRGYSKSGDILFKIDYPSDWDLIEPGTPEDRLKNILCK